MLTKERRIKEKIKQLKNNKEEKNIMKNKGISLITLVITIIIMIILAGAIILALTNSGIFDKANDAVSKYSLKQVQSIADLAWAEAYADNIRDKDGLQKAVDKALEDNDLDDKYKAVADEKGVTVTEKVESVASNWVSEYTDEGVPIPLGFVASPYGEHDDFKAENTKDGGLVIYALTPEEIEKSKTEKIDILAIDGENGELTLKEAHYASMETRNQFVWVPVNKDNFKDEFVRDSFGQITWIDDDETGEEYEVALELSKELGKGYWELVLDENNMPADNTKNIPEYVSQDTLDEATAMYESVAEYGGFYIARYEVGYNYDKQNNKIPSITMGKYPYIYVKWSDSIKETANDGGAVALSRAFYPKDNNNYGVVSTLTYEVQWDTTLNWWTGKDLKDSTNYGNHYNTAIAKDDEKNEYNDNAKYTDDAGSSWKDAVAKKNGDEWLLTTGAFKNANVNNIYDMAGNLFEWTMGGYSSGNRVHRGGGFGNFGDDNLVFSRRHFWPGYEIYNIGFRPSLYIKVK